MLQLSCVRIALLTTLAAVAGAEDVRPPSGTTLKPATSAAAVFEHPRLIEFVNDNCAAPYPKNKLHSDKTICDILKTRNVEELEELTECIMCCQLICSATLSTTRCGHVSHQKCRFRTGTSSCHYCRGEGSYKRPGRSTLFKKVLVILEEIGWMNPAPQSEIDEQQRERQIFDRRRKRGPVEYDLESLIDDLETRTSPTFVPSSSNLIPDQLRRIFDAAKKTMETCERNVVWRGMYKFDTDMQDARAKLAAIVEAMEFDTRVVDRLDLLRPTEDIRAWMHQINWSLHRILIKELPTSSNDALMDHEESFKWFARSVMLLDFLRTFPCQGHFRTSAVQKDWLLLYAGFLKTHGVYDGEDAVKRDDDFGPIVRNLSLWLVELEDPRPLPTPTTLEPVSEEQLRESVATALTNGRKTFDLLWNKHTCGGRSDARGYQFKHRRETRDEYISELRQLLPNLWLPHASRANAVQLLATADTRTCVSTLTSLRRFGDLVLRSFEDAYEKEMMSSQSRLTDWMQRLVGLRSVAIAPASVWFHFSDVRVKNANDLFYRNFGVAVANLRSRMTLQSLSV